MEMFGGSIDLARIVFLLGAVVALLYKKKIGVNPGGIIVPGTMAAILFTGLIPFALTLVTCAISYFTYKLAFARYPMSNRWSSIFIISMSVIIGLVISAITSGLHVLNWEVALASIIVPGLFTIAAKKYDVKRVTIGMLVVTVAVYLIGLLLLNLLPAGLLTNSATQLAAYGQLKLENVYFVLPVSLLMSALIYWKFGLRGGGYLIGPILATVAVNSPVQALMLVAGTAISFLAVKAALRFTSIIGLERFVLSLFLGYIVVSAMDMLAIYVNIPGYQTATVILIIAVAVLTNDMTLQPFRDSVQKGIGPSMAVSLLTRLAV